MLDKPILKIHNNKDYFVFVVLLESSKDSRRYPRAYDTFNRTPFSGRICNLRRIFDKWVSKVLEVAGISLFQTAVLRTSRENKRPGFLKSKRANSYSFGARSTGSPFKEILPATGSI